MSSIVLWRSFKNLMLANYGIKEDSRCFVAKITFNIDFMQRMKKFTTILI